MLKVEVNGFNIHSDNRIETTRSPDDRAEHEFGKIIVKGIHPNNHNVVMRMDDISPQARANFLLEGRRDEVSLCLKFVNLGYAVQKLETVEITKQRKAGFFCRVPNNGYTPDHLFMKMLRKWFDLIPDLHDYTDDPEVNVGKAILLPPRSVEIERPARVELVFGIWQAFDWEYWATPVRLKMLGHHITHAVNEFDDKFNGLDGWEMPVKSTLEKLAEMEQVKEKPKATRKKARQE